MKPFQLDVAFRSVNTFPYPSKSSAICKAALGLPIKPSPRTWRCPSLLLCRGRPRPFDLRSSGVRATRSPAPCSPTYQWDGPEKWHRRSHSPADRATGRHHDWLQRDGYARWGIGCVRRCGYLVCVQTQLFNHSKRLSSECFVNLKQVHLVQLPAGFLHLSEKKWDNNNKTQTFVFSSIVTFGCISYSHRFSDGRYRSSSHDRRVEANLSE